MSEKSHVSLEQHLCIVCLDNFDTGTVLLDKRLRQSLDRYTTTGWSMCPGCAVKRDEGYIALIAVDPDKSKAKPNAWGQSRKDDTIRPQDAYRTGDIAHVRTEAFTRIFNVPVPEKGVAYVDPEVIAMLKKLNEGSYSDE